MSVPMAVRCFELTGASLETARELMAEMNRPKNPESPLKTLQSRLGLHLPVQQEIPANGIPAREITVFPELFTQGRKQFFLLVPMDNEGKCRVPPGAQQVTDPTTLFTLCAEFRKGRDKVFVGDRPTGPHIQEIQVPELKAA